MAARLQQEEPGTSVFIRPSAATRQKELRVLSDLQAAVLDWAGQGLLVTIMELVVC